LNRGIPICTDILGDKFKNQEIGMINPRRLFICSCIALVTSAFTFSLHGDVMQEIGQAFNFTQEQNGAIGLAIFWGMAASMLVGGFVCDFLGLKNVMFVALACHLTGSLGIVFARQIMGEGKPESYYHWLWCFAFIMGCGNGATEVGINPLVATMYARNKTHYLNILHAWWPGGLVIGGLLAVFVRQVLFHQSGTLLFGQLELWQASLLLIVVPALVYGFILIGSQFPVTERVESGVSTSDMFKEALRPMFLLWAFCMLLTAATELGPQKWQNSVMTSTLKFQSAGTLILIFTSGMMFVLRHFAGPIAHRLSPVGMLTVSAILSFIGLYLLSFAHNVATAFGYAFIYGLGIAYFWPTMLGVAAERFPRGGALILALMGTAGNISVGASLLVMGGIVDHYNVSYIQEHDPSLAGTYLKKNQEGKPIALDEDAIKALEKRVANAQEAEAAQKFESEGKVQSAQDLKAKEVIDAAKREGFSQAFRWVATYLTLPVIFIFAAIAISNRLKGGYRAVHISETIEPEATPL